jgi:hypothetical protein
MRFPARFAWLLLILMGCRDHGVLRPTGLAQTRIGLEMFRSIETHEIVTTAVGI